MLVTFHSTATPDVVMLRDLAAYLLGVVGKRLETRGVILHEEAAAAIDRLEAALREDARIAEEHGAAYRARPDVQSRTGAGLRSRALPFLDMLRMAEGRDADILWSA
jgi:hypothetical protein